jgi:hypothetical protein
MTMRGLLMVSAGFVTAFAAGWLGYPAIFYRAEEQPLTFNHAVHTGASAGMACGDCHLLADDGRFEGIPGVGVCAGCHSAPIGGTESEKLLVERYVVPGTEIPWRSYWRQPDNAWFSHAVHSGRSGLACSDCHGGHGESATLETPMVNRLSGYPISVDAVRLGNLLTGRPGGMKMDRCTGCHSARGFRTGCLNCHK